MSKSKNINYKEAKKELEKPTIKSSIESLRVQLKDYREKAEYFKNMALKAEGALQVLTELEDDGNS